MRDQYLLGKPLVKLSTSPNRHITNRDVMCYFERITFRCRHQVYRRFSYCHFARNDPVHACFGVKVVKREWTQGQEDCDECIYQREPMGQQQQQQQQQ
ncbi:MAG: hypothetical protein Q9220_003377 [cf. Caloplaca sp. 1 TL-2023]